MDKVRAHPLDIARDVHAHAALVHFLEQDAQLHFSEPRAHASVDAAGTVTCRVGGGKQATILAHSDHTPPWLLANWPRQSLPPGLNGTATVTCR